jgi:hypothetical protein
MQISSLKNIFNSDEDLSLFINENLIDLSEYLCNCDSQNLYEERRYFYDLIASFQSKFQKMNFNEDNIKFIYLLLEISQRLGHRSNFLYLYKIIKQTKQSPGSRIEAAAKYYAFGKNSEELLSDFNEIHDYLQISLIEEHDSEKLIYTCFFNYYVYLVTHFSFFNPTIIDQLKYKIQVVLENIPESFLHHPIIKRMLSIETDNTEEAIKLLNFELKNFSTFEYKDKNEQQGDEIENATEYTEAINIAENINYDSFLTISKRLYNKNKSDDIWQSLNRGIAILENEIQLLGYIHSYGEMHKEKMKTAISFFKNIDTKSKIIIYDWGCGQGLGSICLCDELKNKNLLHNIDKIILIEPSSLAIKRAGFNLSKYTSKMNLKLFNTNLNNFLKYTNYDHENIKIHIFSNILDIEDFSIKQLISFLSNNFTGLNYFICTSPKLPPPKDFRFHFFIDQFKKYPSFELLGSVSQGKYEWRGDKTWTREVSVFKVQL